MTARPEGYSAGWVGGEYLTIPGSAHNRVMLFPTAEEAHAHWQLTWPRLADLEIRRVRSVWHPGVTITQTAYRILGV